MAPESLGQRIKAAAVYAEHEIELLIETHGQLPAGIVREAEHLVEEVLGIDPQAPAAAAAPAVPGAVQSAAPVPAS